MNRKDTELAIIGAGAAGLSAAAVTAAAGCHTLVIDREDFPGGILRQCIHNGFGLRYFKKELTGPEYAERITQKAVHAGAELFLGATVMEINRQEDGSFELPVMSAKEGLTLVHAEKILLAMGCRERTRSSIATPGTRPAGIFTAGTAQRLLNMEGKLPGTRAVIVGSGDIGLIMARRLRWCGIEVEAVVEIMPHPAGLTRNIVQCLEDFSIPLYLSHSVVNILGTRRVTGVDVAPVENGVPVMEKVFRIPCDTILFSVGLVPEMELAVQAGVKLNPATNGAFVNASYQTGVPGIFSAGNVLHVHDLVDCVSAEAERAARAILDDFTAGTDPVEESPILPGSNLKYAVPNRYFHNRKTLVSFRPLISADSAVLTAELNGKKILSKKLQFVRPAEMLQIEMDGTLLTGGELVFHLQEYR